MHVSLIRQPLIAIALLVGSLSSSGTAFAQGELLPAVSISAPRLTRETWPGRFNADGFTDLIGTDRTTGNLVVLFGTGDGNFAGTAVTDLKAYPIAVRDVNGDGLADVVAIGANGQLYVLRGNGDGSFAIATTFRAGFYTFALIEDFDRDGLRDLAVGEEGTSLHLFHGFGDFTFAPPVTYETGAWPHGAIAADFNGDQRLDIVVASRYQHLVDVFMNFGGLLFTRADIDMDRSATDAVARDLNGDSRVDLIVAARGASDDGPWVDGYAYVFMGHGNGTFAPPVKYATAAGTHSIVLGDFTRDGKTDIATANRSANYLDDTCGDTLKNVDSVSILPGNGDGTFGRHTSFAIDSQAAMWNSFDLLKNDVESLNTNDVNGDGHTDLIASHGIVILNEAPRENRPPVANAGEDQRAMGFSEVFLKGGGVDPDGHFLTFAWVDGNGAPVSSVAFTCLTGYPAGSHTFTVIADDGQGATATDSMVFTFVADNAPPTVQIQRPAAGAVLQAAQPSEIEWTAADSDGAVADTTVEVSEDDGATWLAADGCDVTVELHCAWTPRRATEFARVRVTVFDDFGSSGQATSARFRVTSASGANPLPVGWFSDDVGAVGAAGRAAYTNGTFTVVGSGADVWGTADELHFAYTQVRGDFDFIARVASVQNLDKWVKAGLMVRENTGAGARHAFALATPRTERGIAFQRRPAAGGTSVSTAGPAIAPPVWFWVVRRGDFISAFYKRAEGDPWTEVGRQTFSALSTSVLVGFGVSSHVDGTFATATFDHVSLIPLASPGFAANWGAIDVGDVGTRGSTLYTSGRFNVKGSGADVWGTADEMHYGYTFEEGDFDFSARVVQVDNIDKWVKAGLMVRESFEAGSPHAFAIATPRIDRGVVFQRRPTRDGLSVSTAGPAWAPPLWLKLSRRGNTITAYYRRTADDAWIQFGTQTYATLHPSLLIGFAVSSHVDGTVATGVFEHVTIDHRD